MIDIKEVNNAAFEWVFETNGHKWSNNDDTAGDNYGSFLEGVKWYSNNSFTKDDIIEIFDIVEGNDFLTDEGKVFIREFISKL